MSTRMSSGPSITRERGDVTGVDRRRSGGKRGEPDEADFHKEKGWGGNCRELWKSMVEFILRLG